MEDIDITMFPRVKRIPHERFDELIVKFYDLEQSIEFDRCKCIGCGICSRACPNQVIYMPSTEGKIRINREDLIPSIPNPRDCSFCGTCSYLCPTSAIWLKKDGKYIKRKEFKIVNKNIVPILDYELIELENPNVGAKAFLSGNVEVDWKKCISCMSCVNVCPTSCFTKQLPKNEERSKNKKSKPSFNGKNCMKCGSCVNACSQGAIELIIDGINQSGKFKEIFWNSLITRLKSI